MSGAKETDRVARLLAENLGQPDHRRVAVELLGEINHLVSRVLLFTWSCSGQKGRERCHRERVALRPASRFIL